MNDGNQPPESAEGVVTPQPLGRLQRRILGVLMEKARTTPDAYPLTLNALVAGCNQKSNRHPLMNLQPSQVEEELEMLRTAGIVAEVQGGSRVPKYRHYGYDYLGVKGAEAAVMIELLLRGEQTAGELRTRAGRFEPIADLATLQTLLDSLRTRGLVIALTPAGRGQLWTHNLYMPEELRKIQAQVSSSSSGDQSAAAVLGSSITTTSHAVHRAPPPDALAGTMESSVADELQELREEVGELRQLVERLSDRLERLEG